MPRRSALAVLLSAALLFGARAGAGDPAAAEAAFLAEIRKEFDAAPESAAATERLLARLAARFPGGTENAPPVIRAYSAALEGLRGKHSRKPWNQYRRAKAGLAQLDALVAAHPAADEIRMLRCSYGLGLPGFFGAGSRVAEDRAILAERLARGADPTVAGEYRRGLMRWILEKGHPTPAERARLETALAE